MKSSGDTFSILFFASLVHLTVDAVQSGMCHFSPEIQAFSEASSATMYPASVLVFCGGLETLEKRRPAVKEA